MVWLLTNVTGSPAYSCLGNTVIRNKLNELDSVEVQCAGTFTPDTVVKIMDGATEIFRGYVKESLQEANGKLYKLTLVESAQDLKYKIVEYSSSRSFIRNSQTVEQLVDLILTSSGWTRVTTDTTVVTALGFYNTTASSALYKLIKDMQGKYIWFVDDGTNKNVYWGTYRTDRTASPITSYISKQAETDSMDRNITKITVYGENSTIYGSAGTGTKEKIYKYSLAKTTAECTDVATKLLADIGANKQRYTITLAKTNTYFAGDKVKVDSVDYVVFDVSRTQSQTVLGIGAPEISYADTLGSNLTTIDGSIKTPVDASWSGGNSNVAANGAQTTTFTFDLKDVTLISNAKLEMTIGSFVKAANVSVQTDYLSDVSTINTSAAYTDTSTTFDAATYLPDSDGIECVASTGYQFALLTINGTLRTAAASKNVEIHAEYSYNGIDWYDSGAQDLVYMRLTTEPYHFNFSSIIPGGTSSVYVRWKFLPDNTGIITIYNRADMQAQLVSRHKHSVTTTYDKTTTGTPPTSLNVQVNSYSITYSGTPLDIQSYLQTGKNIISVWTSTGATNQCSVNPTITYQTLGS